MASSVWVGQSTAVSLYEHVAYGGRYVQFTHDDPDFTKKGWLNDAASAVKVFSLKVVCTITSQERVAPAPIVTIPTPVTIPTYSIGGRIKNAATGAYLNVLTGFTFSARNSAGAVFNANIFGNKFLFPALAEGQYEFTISGPGFISLKIVKIVTKNNSSLADFWDFVLSQALSANQWRFVLTWNSSPKDLDSMLVLPGKELVYFRNKKSKSGNAVLDVDNTKGFGPETITVINNLSAGQTYRYYVYNYSKTPSISVSEAKVTVYNGSQIVRSFVIPTQNPSGLLYWHVFDFTNAGVSPVNQLEKAMKA